MNYEEVSKLLDSKIKGAKEIQNINMFGFAAIVAAGFYFLALSSCYQKKQVDRLDSKIGEMRKECKCRYR